MSDLALDNLNKDFESIWRRYYDTADRRFKEGLTYNELWFVVYGEKKEEE